MFSISNKLWIWWKCRKPTTKQQKKQTVQHAVYCSYRVSSSLPHNDPAAVNLYKLALFQRAVIIHLLTQTQYTQPSSHPLLGMENNAVAAITLMQLSQTWNFLTALHVPVFREQRGKWGLSLSSRTPGPRLWALLSVPARAHVPHQLGCLKLHRRQKLGTATSHDADAREASLCLHGVLLQSTNVQEHLGTSVWSALSPPPASTLVPKRWVMPRMLAERCPE